MAKVLDDPEHKAQQYKVYDQGCERGASAKVQWQRQRNRVWHDVNDVRAKTPLWLTS